MSKSQEGKCLRMNVREEYFLVKKFFFGIFYHCERKFLNAIGTDRADIDYYILLQTKQKVFVIQLRKFNIDFVSSI